MFWDNYFNLIKLYLYAQGSVFEVSFVFFRFRTYQNQNTGQKYSKSKEYTGYYPGAMVISTDHILFEYLLCRGTFREPRYVATECADSHRAPITCAKIKGASVPAVLKLLSGKGGFRIWRKSEIALFS